MQKLPKDQLEAIEVALIQPLTQAEKFERIALTLATVEARTSSRVWVVRGIQHQQL